MNLQDRLPTDNTLAPTPPGAGARRRRTVLGSLETGFCSLFRGRRETLVNYPAGLCFLRNSKAIRSRHSTKSLSGYQRSDRAIELFPDGEWYLIHKHERESQNR